MLREFPRKFPRTFPRKFPRKFPSKIPRKFLGFFLGNFLGKFLLVNFSFPTSDPSRLDLLCNKLRDFLDDFIANQLNLLVRLLRLLIVRCRQLLPPPLLARPKRSLA